MSEIALSHLKLVKLLAMTFVNLIDNFFIIK